MTVDLIRLKCRSYQQSSTCTLPSAVREERARHRARSVPRLSLPWRPHQNLQGRSRDLGPRWGSRAEAEKLAHEYPLRGGTFTHLVTLFPSIYLSVKQVCFKSRERCLSRFCGQGRRQRNKYLTFLLIEISPIKQNKVGYRVYSEGGLYFRQSGPN